MDKNTTAAPTPWRSERTVRDYTKRVLQIRNVAALAKYPPDQVAEETLEHLAATISPTELVQTLIDWGQDKKPGTWLTYRASILWHLNALRTPTSSTASLREQAEAAYLQLRDHDPGFGSTTSKANRPDNRPIHITDEDMDRLVGTLIKQNRDSTGYGIIAQNWLYAARATGLRPNEWEFAKWEDESKTVLLAPNSKKRLNANARIQLEAANARDPDLNARSPFDLEHAGLAPIPKGPQEDYRRIPVNTQVDRGDVDRMLNSVARWVATGRTFAALYQAVRMCVQRAVNRTFGDKKRYSLYVARHQFAADVKKLASPGEVAYLMGHTTERAASSCYGSGRHGRPHAGLGQAPAEGLSEQPGGEAAVMAQQGGAGFSAGSDS